MPEAETKQCNFGKCDHPAWNRWQWAPGRSGGFVCVCCVRKVWQETLDNVTKGLAGLPETCEVGDVN